MTVTCPSKPEAASVGTEITAAKSDWKTGVSTLCALLTQNIQTLGRWTCRVSTSRRWGCTSLLGSCTRSCRKERKKPVCDMMLLTKKNQAGYLFGDDPLGSMMRFGEVEG